ncbi:thioredoxin fold domain-containing protein [Rhodoferax sp. GW822-FHT02A01]|uniref:thioredoxin fold domain-containing protein n=1 Tax=Rhodoferax sp. GW822-FHT02A01 TaxID=3141537 RepID=UPI00315D5F29
MAQRFNPLFRAHLRYALCSMVVALAACNEATPPAPPPPALKKPQQQYEALKASAKGIATGPATSDYTVYVMFDPQCQHCARLWEEAQALQATVRFVWVPVTIMDVRSAAISAALLGSASAQEDLRRQEKAVLQRTEGIKGMDPVPPYLDSVVKANTDLINRFRVLGVPYVVARNQTTSEYVSHEGVMSREMLQRFLGLGSR